MERNQVFSIQITDLNHSGEGVGRRDGRVVFVPYAAPGDSAVVRIADERRGFARAELLSLDRESPDRVPPPCPVYLRCGGCQLQHISYDAQIAYKKRRVEQALRRIGKFDAAAVNDCLPAPSVFHYRNKAKYSYLVRRESGTGFVSGFFGRRAHEVVDFNECMIQNRTNNEVFRAVNAILAHREVPVWRGDDDGNGPPNHRRPSRSGSGPPLVRVAGSGGALKHLVVRCDRHGRQALAVVIGCGGPIRGIEIVADELALAVPGIVGVVEEVELPNRRGRAEHVRCGARGGLRDVAELCEGTAGGSVTPASWRGLARVVKGAGFFRERILGLEFVVSARSFLQVNPEGMEVLYREVLRAADPSGDEVALDAYCGIGSISLALARESRYVWGIEEAGFAVQDARRNAALNSIANCGFIAGRVEDVLAAWLQGAGEDRGTMGGLPNGESWHPARDPFPPSRRVDVAVLDPPREGCDERAIRALASLGPGRIVYVSCDPETLARDLRMLADTGYELASVQPVDMFPQTSHVETVVLLLRAGTA